MLGAGRQLAPALLFLGCRDPEVDALYAEELARWQGMGAVDVRHAYSRATERSEGCRYVQDRLYHDKEDVFELWMMGAKVYICGGREVGVGVEDVCVKLAAEGGDRDEAAARKWWEGIRNERYATDVFD